MRDLTVIGIDIAKNNMQLHGADSQGKVLFKKRVSRENFLKVMSNLPKCTVGMEACGGAQYWARELTTLGFTVKLMSPRKVKKFVENHKNDAKDAEACSEAVMKKNMTFVPIKTEVQSDIQTIHRVRRFYVKQQTALINMIRGLLLELGIAIAEGKTAFKKKMSLLLEAENQALLPQQKNMFQNLYQTLKHFEDEIERYTHIIETLAVEDENARQLMSLPGVGPITATALVAKIGNGSEFQKGRELSAYLGLVPKQASSGDKIVLLGISKHGDRYLRELLIHGGRSALRAALRKNKLTGLFEKQDEHSQWMRALAERVGMNKASVAIANKNARIAIALLKNQAVFQPQWAHQQQPLLENEVA
jgi:transposase